MTTEQTAAAAALLTGIDQHLDRLGHLEELTEARYHETHDVFESQSNQRALILDWFENWAGSVAWRGDRAARILSVGCGSGTLDSEITDRLDRLTPALELTGVDPNPRHTRAFVERLKPRVAKVHAATCPFEDFQAEASFDLIYFAHSLYYLEELEAALDKALELLLPGGWLVILQAPNGALNQLAHRLWKKQWNRSAWYSDDIETILANRSDSFRIQRLDARVDVTTCLDDNSGHGRKVLDFLVQADTAGFSPALQSLLRKKLELISEYRDGRYLAPHPVDAIVYEKE